ncbi:MAG: divalent-cation tolerance protein CutA [Gammaproteobacteria bacterium]|nr:divalent-cation tolerance protein CutA [Gammaproteobacteria bacterium]MDH5593815.1 divalent-cation tolerance protein CutA [Gammaproteobacteria bacterium]
MVQDINPENYHIVLNTCPDMGVAKNLATLLVKNRMAACINIIPGLTSIYEWKGKLETGTECLLVIKSVKNSYPELEKMIRENHPYELPEIISVSVSGGLNEYLGWISQQCE